MILEINGVYWFVKKYLDLIFSECLELHEINFWIYINTDLTLQRMPGEI